MKVLVFLAEGFEEVEALTVVNYLRRADVKVETISITEDQQVKGAHDIIVTADKKMSELGNSNQYNGVVLPGGMPGAINLRDNDKVIEIVQEFNEDKKLVAAICAGPIILQKAGIISGRKITSYPGFEEQLEGCKYSESSVVRDGNIITSRGASIAGDFAMAIVEYLFGEGKINDLKKGIAYDMSQGINRFN